MQLITKLKNILFSIKERPFPENQGTSIFLVPLFKVYDGLEGNSESKGPDCETTKVSGGGEPQLKGCASRKYSPQLVTMRLQFSTNTNLGSGVAVSSTVLHVSSQRWREKVERNARS